MNLHILPKIIRVINQINNYYNALPPKKFSRMVGIDLNDNEEANKFRIVEKQNPKCRLILDDINFVWVQDMVRN